MPKPITYITYPLLFLLLLGELIYGFLFYQKQAKINTLNNVTNELPNFAFTREINSISFDDEVFPRVAYYFDLSRFEMQLSEDKRELAIFDRETNKEVTIDYWHLDVFNIPGQFLNTQNIRLESTQSGHKIVPVSCTQLKITTRLQKQVNDINECQGLDSKNNCNYTISNIECI